MNTSSMIISKCLSSAKQQRLLAAIAVTTTTTYSGLWLCSEEDENYNNDYGTTEENNRSHQYRNGVDRCLYGPSNKYTLAEGKRMKIVRASERYSNKNSTTNNNDPGGHGDEEDKNHDDAQQDDQKTSRHFEDEDEEDELFEEDDEDDEEELPPWWGPRLVRRLTRHFTRQTVRGVKGGSGSGDAHIPTDDGSMEMIATGDDDNGEEDTIDYSELFHGQCLIRQMHIPALPYPAWDYNWDGLMTDDTSLEGHRTGKASMANTYNKTRHIILVRHGQYNENPRDDVNRKLTPLGRRQAVKTGRRLAQIANGSNRFKDIATRGPCPIKVIRVSNMRRAKETAELIARELKRNSYEVQMTLPDEDLNEALPAPMSPIRPELSWATEEIDHHKERVERSFRKYFYRDTKTTERIQKQEAHLGSKKTSLFPDDDEEGEKEEEHRSPINEASDEANTDENDLLGSLISFGVSVGGGGGGGGNDDHDGHDFDDYDDDDEQDEFEIIVGHGNLIRYFFCRALQLPPEIWLRLSLFNCSLTYLMIRPNGMVTARMMGDIGHLDYEETTFSSNYGFKW